MIGVLQSSRFRLSYRSLIGLHKSSVNMKRQEDGFPAVRKVSNSESWFIFSSYPNFQ
jgi:hypothetical protein